VPRFAGDIFLKSQSLAWRVLRFQNEAENYAGALRLRLLVGGNNDRVVTTGKSRFSPQVFLIRANEEKLDGISYKMHKGEGLFSS
jgi:hypothetical protein